MRMKLGAGLLACGLVWGVGACSKHELPAESASAPPAAEEAAADAGAGEAGLAAQSAQAQADATVAQTQLQSAAVTQDDGERRFIRTADAKFRVREVYRSALAIEDLVAQHGGFVARNEIRTDVNDVETRPSGDGKLLELATYTVHGDMQVRVPSTRAQAFLRALADQVEFLDNRSFSAVDAQFELLRQRLAFSRHQDAQRALAGVAAGQGKVAEKAGAIDARTESQGQRDEALIAHRTFEDRVAFATINLALYQSPLVRRNERLDVDAVVRSGGPGFLVRLGHSLGAGWFLLLDVLIALFRLWPLWLVIVLAIMLRRRRYVVAKA